MEGDAKIVVAFIVAGSPDVVIIGTKLNIKAEGEDAEQLIEALRELVEEKMFDEPPPISPKICSIALTKEVEQPAAEALPRQPKHRCLELSIAAGAPSAAYSMAGLGA